MAARWLVDGMNVVGSRPDGWWSDRPGAMRRLVASLEAFARESGDEVIVVFDGSPPPASATPARKVEVHFAGHADDAIVRVLEDRDPATLTVVTSDTGLAERVRARGGQVSGAGAFRRRLDAADRSPTPRRPEQRT